MVVRTFLPYTKTVRKPGRPEYSLYPATVGEHLRKVRIERGQLQKTVAAIIGVSENTITFWEKGRAVPQVRYYPAIISYLHYYPFTHNTDHLSGKLQQVRFCNGWTFKQLAQTLNLDTGTVTRWEKRKSDINAKSQLKIMKLWLALPEYLKNNTA